MSNNKNIKKMIQNLLSSLCSCVQPKSENVTLKIECIDNCLNETNFIKFQTNTKCSDKRLDTSLSPINNTNINNNYINSSIKNLKLELPLNNSFNYINLSNINNSDQMSPCNSSLNSHQKKLIIKHNKRKKLINENDIFNRFQENVDNIINEIKRKRTISESDDSENCFSK